MFSQRNEDHNTQTENCKDEVYTILHNMVTKYDPRIISMMFIDAGIACAVGSGGDKEKILEFASDRFDIRQKTWVKFREERMK